MIITTVHPQDTGNFECFSHEVRIGHRYLFFLKIQPEDSFSVLFRDEYIKNDHLSYHYIIHAIFFLNQKEQKRMTTSY